MDHEQRSDHTGEKRRAGAGPKKKYVPPAIEKEDVFEPQALGCGQQAGQGLRCNANPSS